MPAAVDAEETPVTADVANVEGDHVSDCDVEGDQVVDDWGYVVAADDEGEGGEVVGV